MHRAANKEISRKAQNDKRESSSVVQNTWAFNVEAYSMEFYLLLNSEQHIAVAIATLSDSLPPSLCAKEGM